MDPILEGRQCSCCNPKFARWDDTYWVMKVPDHKSLEFNRSVHSVWVLGRGYVWTGLHPLIPTVTLTLCQSHAAWYMRNMDINSTANVPGLRMQYYTATGLPVEPHHEHTKEG